jgi:hypothetical protein
MEDVETARTLNVYVDLLDIQGETCGVCVPITKPLRSSQGSPSQ